MSHNKPLETPFAFRTLAAMAVLKGEAVVAALEQTKKREVAHVSLSKHRRLRRRVDKLERVLASRD